MVQICNKLTLYFYIASCVVRYLYHITFKSNYPIVISLRIEMSILDIKSHCINHNTNQQDPYYYLNISLLITIGDVVHGIIF